jgi:hypothetical protein
MKNHMKKYDKDNPDQAKKRSAKRAKLQMEAKGSHTNEDIETIRKQLGDRCYYCDDPLFGGGEIEHMQPISRGGSNDPSKLTFSCLLCNHEKHNKTEEEYIAHRKKRGFKIVIRN